MRTTLGTGDTMRKIVIAILLLLLIVFPAMAATNSRTSVQDSVEEFINGYRDGSTQVGSNIQIPYGDGTFYSMSFPVPNSTSATISVTNLNTAAETFAYGWKNSTRWLNSSDYRHTYTGDINYLFSHRYSFNYPVGSTGATIDDVWVDGGISQESMTLYNDAIIVESGSGLEESNYIEFDGTDDYGTITLPQKFNLRSNWSLSYMYWCTAISTNSNQVNIYNSTNENNRLSIGTYYNSNRPQYMYYMDAGGTSNTFYNTSAAVHPLGTWVHVRMECNGANLYLYENGRQEKWGTLGGTGSMWVDRISIGGRLSGGTLTYDSNCKMDDLRFYSGRAVSTSNTTSEATYMWNCVNGVSNSVPTNLKINGKSLVYYSMYGSSNTISETFQVDDVTVNFLNTAPTYSSMSPDGTVTNSSTVELSLSAHDADTSYSPNIYATFYVDNVSKGTSATVGDGTISLEVDGLTSDSHNWYATVYDGWSGTITTATKTFTMPGDMDIRDETTGELIDDRNVTVDFYSANASLTTITADGTVDLTGLPTTNLLVSATATGYTPRKTVILDMYDTNSIYMIDSDQDIVYNSFVLNRQTISGNPDDYIVKINKYINGTKQTVFSSFFDFDGKCGTYLKAADVYELVIVSPDGIESEYGLLYPDPDGVVDIAFQGITFNDYVNTWISVNSTIYHDTGVTIAGYTQSDQSHAVNPIYVTNSTYTITDSDGNIVYTDTSNSSTYLYQYILTQSDRYTIDYYVYGEDASGQQYDYHRTDILDFSNGVVTFMPNAPTWLITLCVTFICILTIVAFSEYRSDLGAGVSFAIYAWCDYQGFIDVSYLGMSIMALVTMGAFMRTRRTIRRGG